MFETPQLHPLYSSVGCLLTCKKSEVSILGQVSLHQDLSWQWRTTLLRKWPLIELLHIRVNTLTHVETGIKNFGQLQIYLWLRLQRCTKILKLHLLDKTSMRKHIYSTYKSVITKNHMDMKNQFCIVSISLLFLYFKQSFYIESSLKNYCTVV